MEIANAGPAKAHHEEWETTISVELTPEEFRSVRHPTDVIFVFSDGSRLARRRIETKEIVTSKHVMGFHEEMYALRRTTATETPRPIDSIFVVRATLRKMYYVNDIRVSYNQENNEQGTRYYKEFEIEYPAGSSYAQILKYEEQLMRYVYETRQFCRRDRMCLEDIFASIMCKVQMWHCFDKTQPYAWAYKWNGIKAKVMIFENDANVARDDDDEHFMYLWSDVGEIQTLRCIGQIDQRLFNTCLLVEIMEDCIVIIEAIGLSYKKQIYTTEPQTNIRLLECIGAEFAKLPSPPTVDGKPLLVQKFYRTPLPESYDESRYDGFIIVQNDIVIKWKIPTIDVKCVAPYTFSVAKRKYYIRSCRGVVGSIYEMAYNRHILRTRLDRKAASSENEHNVFLESCAMLDSQQSTDAQSRNTETPEAEPADSETETTEAHTSPHTADTTIRRGV